MTTATTLPGLVTGVWALDPSHTEVGFSVRHLMVSKVRGTFRTFSGEITVADDVLDSSVRATIDLNSIDTNDANRDTHLRSADFFEVDTHKEMTFASTSLRPDGGDFALVGDLTIKGVTREVELKLEFNGVHPDPWGGTRAGFSAEGEISRGDFGIDFQIPLDGGGVVVGDKIKIALEIEAVLQTA
jgi:polyisoprenoid-binding protein YceI